MFDLIPLSSYSAIFFHILFVIMFVIFMLSVSYTFQDYQTLSISNFLGYALFVFVLLYMGLRPISGYYFGDMGTYAVKYHLMELGEEVKIKSDFVFTKFMLISSKTYSVEVFFFICAVMYIVPCFLFSKKYAGKYWFFMFFMFLGSFSFWAYGTNGIRNGIATSLFILALYFYNRKIIMYFLFFLSFGFHNSMMIPLAAFFVSGLYKNPKVYLYIWLAAIPISFVAGNSLGEFFSGLVSDDRAGAYISDKKVDTEDIIKIGFRWDFIFYSGFAVFAGWYFIIKKNIKDNFYIHLFGTYMIANAFWILVIRANFSNRFAYLSWFLMAAVISYPILKYKIWNDQFKILGGIIVIYFMFTYILFLKT